MEKSGRRTFSLILLAFFLLVVQVMSAKDKTTESLSYEITCAGTGQQGFYLVEVTAYVPNKKNINMDEIKKCAIHGIIFKGFTGQNGCQSQKPMIYLSKEQQYADFFNEFFKHDYLQYASAVDPTINTMKIGKKYAITATLLIAKDSLRETLEKAGIVKKLGF